MHEKFSSQLPTEIRILEDRLLCTIQNCENIANDESIDPMAHLDSERLKIDCSIIVVRILRKGPRMLNIDRPEQRQERLQDDSEERSLCNSRIRSSKDSVPFLAS